MHKLLLACALLLSALFPTTQAQAAECIEITPPNTIVAPGNWCLSAGYSGSTVVGALLMIDADDVTFDCRGMSLHNTQTNTSANNYAIYVADQRHVRIRNCKISGGWTVGIYVTQNNTLANATSDISITDNDVSGAHWFGIHAYGTDIEIARNRVNDIGGRGSFAMGIRVGGSVLAGEKRFHVVRDNTISDVVSPVNHAYGIYSNNTDDGDFAGNTIVGSLGASTWFNYGIKVNTGARTRITGNNIVGGLDGYAIGIQAPATDKCYHNDLRADYPPLTCDDTHGNYGPLRSRTLGAVGALHGSRPLRFAQGSDHRTSGGNACFVDYVHSVNDPTRGCNPAPGNCWPVPPRATPTPRAGNFFDHA